MVHPCKYAKFAGHFTFADNQRLPALLVQEWDNTCRTVPHPGMPVLWRPCPNGTSLHLLNNDPFSETEFVLAYDWIACTADLVLSHRFKLQGEVWYQGEESLDTGRIFTHSTGQVEAQSIKLCPGVAGAAARNDVLQLHSLSHDSIQAKDAFGRTAFMHAAKGDSWAVLQELLAHPGWINWLDACCDDGMTALHYLSRNPPMMATTRQYAQTLALLPLDLPASCLNALDSNGRSPLRHAVEARNKPMTTWLLQHGAMPDHCGVSNSRPIFAAISLKDVSFLQQLLDAGSSVHVVDSMQQTPLNKALQWQHAEHLQLLVFFGANCDSQHAQFHFGSRQSRTIRQVIEDFPDGTSGARLKLAVRNGLAARRRMVVMILAVRVAPDAGLLALFCEFEYTMIPI